MHAYYDTLRSSLTCSSASIELFQGLGGLCQGKKRKARAPTCQLAASFVGFPALNAFKTPEAQVTVIVKVGFLTIFKIFLETLDVTWQAVQSLQKAPTSKSQIHLRKLESWECRLLRSCSWTSCLQRHSPRLLAREGNTNPVHSSTYGSCPCSVHAQSSPVFHAKSLQREHPSYR